MLIDGGVDRAGRRPPGPGGLSSGGRHWGENAAPSLDRVQDVACERVTVSVRGTRPAPQVAIASAAHGDTREGRQGRFSKDVRGEACASHRQCRGLAEVDHGMIG